MHDEPDRGTSHARSQPVSRVGGEPFRARSQRRQVVRALSHRNFQLFFGGQLISLIGTWMQSVAQAWLVYRLTGSTVALGMVGFSGQFPVFLLAPIGGAVADRYGRRRILVGTQSAAMLLAFVLAALTLMDAVRVWHIFAVAGVLVASIGEGWCFFVNAVSCIAVIVGLLLMDITLHVRVPLAGSARAEIGEGFRFVGRTSPVLALLLLLGVVSLMGMPYAVLMPIFADRILHGGASGLGLLMGASGVGALAGALTLASRQGVRGLGRWVALSCAGFGVSLVLFSLSRSFWLSAALLVPTGFSMMVQMAASNTLVQTMVPDALRGRVMATYSMMFMGMAPFGALLAGMLAGHIGAPNTVALGGAVCIIGAIVFGLRLPALRHEARQIIVALQMAGGDPAEEVTGEGSVVAPRDA